MDDAIGIGKEGTENIDAGGQRSWREIDVFAIASTQTRGSGFCGSHKLYEQLSQIDVMETLAERIADFASRTVYFEELVQVINKAKLPGYAQDRYWTIHLARICVPSFSGVTLLQRVRYRPECACLLQSMGEGASALVLLGVPDDDPYGAMLELCGIVKKRWGATLGMQSPSSSLTSCVLYARRSG